MAEKTSSRAERLLAFLEELNRECEGFIPFERFMREALYHPAFGYYSTGISQVGPQGDFSTAATLSTRLGQGIAGWIEARAKELELKKPVPVIELGAGNGALAETILRSLGWWKRRSFQYHIVEISAPLRSLQQERLRGLGKVHWHEDLREVLPEAEGEALIFSNELVDAFPALWLAWDEGWQEIGLRFNPGRGLQEVFRPFDGDPSLSTGLRLADPPKGQRIEVHRSYQRWVRDWASQWRRGAMLTIDYGGSPEAIYHRRMQGSLRAYHRQERIEGPAIYQRFGRQDLTADVNFEDLEAWGEALGWRNLERQNQRDWLGQWAPGQNTFHDSQLEAEGGAGDAFHVLEQRPL